MIDLAKYKSLQTQLVSDIREAAKELDLASNALIQAQAAYEKAYSVLEGLRKAAALLKVIS